jgi:acetyl-CoA carboxylase biotin carboxyl carrier protein
MSNDEIKELVQLVVDSGIAEIEVQRGNSRVRIRRTHETKSDSVVSHVMASSMPSAMVHPAPHAEAVPAAAPAPPAATSPTTPGRDELLVKSPIVGTYYDAPKPGDPPFVRVGDSVEPGHVLCIIESMKLMNEIESEVAGTIVSKLMENGRAVEYGEALFAIRPR